MLFYGDELKYTAKYLYGDLGEPVGMVVYDGESTITYLFTKNMHGDITRIVNANGALIVSYTYDMHGNRTATYNSNTSNTIGIILRVGQMIISSLTPFGYRGYCYDANTGLYYLQSRYYDPNTGRFINADSTDYLNVSDTVLGCNLFIYCENDPVNFVDPKGNRRITIKTWVVEFAIDATLMILSPYFSWPYDLLGRAVEKMMKKHGWKSVAKYLLTTVVPKFKGMFSKGITLIRKAVWRITGATISWAFSSLANSFIKKIIGVLTNTTYSGFYAIISSFFSAGAFIALMLDFASDKKINDKIILEI